jgi:hypothetical protein
MGLFYSAGLSVPLCCSTGIGDDFVLLGWIRLCLVRHSAEFG